MFLALAVLQDSKGNHKRSSVQADRILCQPVPTRGRALSPVLPDAPPEKMLQSTTSNTFRSSESVRLRWRLNWIPAGSLELGHWLTGALWDWDNCCPADVRFPWLILYLKV